MKQKKASKPKNPKHSLCQFIVGKLITACKPNWAREIKIAQKLIIDYPDPEFWNAVETPFPLSSLAWLLTPDGKEVLLKTSRETKLELPKETQYNIQEEKVGEDKVFQPTKKKTLMDFLK